MFFLWFICSLFMRTELRIFLSHHRSITQLFTGSCSRRYLIYKTWLNLPIFGKTQEKKNITVLSDGKNSDKPTLAFAFHLIATLSHTLAPVFNLLAHLRSPRCNPFSVSYPPSFLFLILFLSSSTQFCWCHASFMVPTHPIAFAQSQYK